MSTNTLTRSKLVTRAIKEVLQYTYFGNDYVAINITTDVEGVDPFKSDVYIITSKKDFDDAIIEITKSKSDFAYADSLVCRNRATSWIKITKAQVHDFQSFPDDMNIMNNLVSYVQELRCDLVDEKFRNAHAKKIYNDVVNKDGANLLYVDQASHLATDIHGKLFRVPIAFNLCESDYHIKDVVKFLRDQKNVKLKTGSFDPAPDFPELTRIPYYNAEFDGELQVHGWVKPTQEQYDALYDKQKHVDSWHLVEHEVLDIKEFRK